MSAPNVSDFLFKDSFLLLKELEKNIREHPDCTGNEPTLDIPIGQKRQIHSICNKRVDHENGR